MSAQLAPDILKQMNLKAKKYLSRAQYWYLIRYKNVIGELMQGYADQETTALQAQVKALEREKENLETELAFTLGCLAELEEKAHNERLRP